MRRGDALVAPTVGTWRPSVGPGAPLSPGMVLGTLLRAGRPLVVTAPAGAGGLAARVAPAGTWVEYGVPLVTIGEGVLEPAAPAEASTGGDALPAGVSAITADTDGTVYLSPQPGTPAFAPPGSTVAPHETLALIEVMKTFTPVRSPVSGVVERVLADEGAAVTAGETLFWVRAGVE